MYKITFKDGTQLENLELNGNNFISPVILSDAVFEGKLGEVRVFDSETETETVYKDMVLIANRVFDGKSWFILAEKTEDDKERERITDMELALTELYEMIIGG